jgi:hypothetical protein
MHAANLTHNHNSNSAPVTTRQNYDRGMTNHVAVEEAQEALDIVLDTFLINSTSAIMLFDS